MTGDNSYLQLDHLLDNLQVEQLDTCLFRGFTKVQRVPRVFGGQVLGQSVNAASRTVSSDRSIHSLHSYFLRPGNPKRAIIYDVDPIRDGGSFTTRRVVAKQDGKAIFNASMSFHKREQGFEHQIQMPTGVPDPQTLASELEYWQPWFRDHPERCPIDLGQYQAIDVRVIGRRDLDNPKPEQPVRGIWLKTSAALENDLAIHRVVLAYISDMHFMGTALRPHPVDFMSPGFQGASLDHAMWFHCDFRIDEWLYYHMDSPCAAGSRGFNRGSFYTRDGRLVASAVQEGLMRLLKSDT